MISTNDSSNLNLALRADRVLNNDGTISSAGDLELSALGSLTNSGTASAQGSVALNAPEIRNNGLVSAATGSINISAPVDSNLNIDNTGGTFRSLNGNINLSTVPGANVKTNTNLVEGDWFAHELNISSGRFHQLRLCWKQYLAAARRGERLRQLSPSSHRV